MSVRPSQDLINFMQTSGIQGLVQDWANASGYTPIDWSNPDLLLSPAAATAAVPSDSFDPSQLTSVLDPSQLTTDLTQLLASFGSADFAQVLASELAAELPQLLGTQLSADLLSAL